MNIVAVGTINPAKVKAVKAVLKDYDKIKPFRVVAVQVESSVPEQPKSLEIICLGARNRALEAYQMSEASLSIGIESGIFFVEDIWRDITCCQIYDGKQYRSGFSSAFEVPPAVLKFVQAGDDLSVATRKAGFTTKKKIGEKEGLVGLLTSRRIDREELAKQALIQALSGIENPHFYE